MLWVRALVYLPRSVKYFGSAVYLGVDSHRETKLRANPLLDRLVIEYSGLPTPFDCAHAG